MNKENLKPEIKFISTNEARVGDVILHNNQICIIAGFEIFYDLDGNQKRFLILIDYYDGTEPIYIHDDSYYQEHNDQIWYIGHLDILNKKSKLFK